MSGRALTRLANFTDAFSWALHNTRARLNGTMVVSIKVNFTLILHIAEGQYQCDNGHSVGQ